MSFSRDMGSAEGRQVKLHRAGSVAGGIGREGGNRFDYVRFNMPAEQAGTSSVCLFCPPALEPGGGEVVDGSGKDGRLLTRFLQ